MSPFGEPVTVRGEDRALSPSCATFASSALSRFLVVSRSCRTQTQRRPAGELAWPTFRSSVVTRT